jgi:hypothetical protein
MKTLLVHKVELQLEIDETDESYKDVVLEYIDLINNIIGMSELGCNPLLITRGLELSDIEIIQE